LLGKENQVSGGQEVGALQRADGAERPTGSTDGLIFDGSNLNLEIKMIIMVERKIIEIMLIKQHKLIKSLKIKFVYEFTTTRYTYLISSTICIIHFPVFA
jgi:hypothetical protein